MNAITKDFYKADIYRFDVETKDNIYQFDVSNVISWDIIRLNMTKDDLKGLADFINKFLEN
jgi:hypothetical protein